MLFQVQYVYAFFEILTASLLLDRSAFDCQDCPPGHYWGDLAHDLLCDGVPEL
jgi:hypothetical protein